MNSNLVRVGGGVVGLCLAVVTALVVSREQAPPPPATHQLRIAVLCGTQTADERAARQGLRLAQQELNESWRADDWGVELLEHDPGGALNSARDQLGRWRADGVTLLVEAIGSEQVLGCARELREDPPFTVLCAGCQRPGIGYTIGDGFFRVVPTAGVEGRELAEWARELGVQRPVVLRQTDDPRGEALQATFDIGAGGFGVQNVLDVDSAAQAEWAAGELRKLSPDALFLFVPAEVGVALAGAAADLDLPLFVPGEVADALVAAKANLQRVHVARPAGASSDEIAAARRETVLERLGAAATAEPSAALHAYDALHVLAHAARRAAGKEPLQLLLALRETRFAGASGVVEFDDDRERRAPRLRRRRFADGVEVPGYGGDPGE